MFEWGNILAGCSKVTMGFLEEEEKQILEFPVERLRITLSGGRAADERGGSGGGH